MDLSDRDHPSPRPGELGIPLHAGDKAIQIDHYLRAPTDLASPQNPKLERTGDGFVWRDGKRIGWISGATFYPMAALDIVGEKVTPKPGRGGIAIASGDLDAAIAQAENQRR
jgi:hypothetical protein